MSTRPSIPVIDLAPWFGDDEVARDALCREVNETCHLVGFFYIRNHGIPQQDCDDYLAMARQFFALPDPLKRSIDKSHSPHFRGWEALGSELTNNQVDYREQIDIGIDRPVVSDPDPWFLALEGPNQWPPDSALPGFRETVSGFMQQLSAVSRILLRIMSLSLGLDQRHIEKVFGENPSPYAKLIRYPGADGQQGVGVHKDSGFLTLLLQDDNPGLMAQANDDTWYAVDPLPGTLVVNTGELLQLVTHNYFIATPHKVEHQGSAERYSGAFFYSPDLRTRLDPLPIDRAFIERAQRSPRHNSEGLMASRAEMLQGIGGMGSRQRPLVFGEKYWERWVRSYPAIARHHYPHLVD